MKDFAFAWVLCSVLFLAVGCNDDASQPAAQSPATDSADRQEVMKPAVPAETTPETEAEATPEAPAETAPEAAADEEPAVDDSATGDAEQAADDSAASLEAEPEKP